MLDKILRGLYYLLFLLTPLVMFPATSEIFEFNKILFIYTATALIGFFWILKMVLNRKIILKKTPLDIPIILFLGALVLSTFFSIDIQTSVFGYYGRFNGGLLSMVSYIFLFYGFISNEIDAKKSIIVSILSSVVVILWGLPGHFNRDLTCPTFNTVLNYMSGKLDFELLKNIWTTKFNNTCWSRETNVFDPAVRMFSTLGQPNWLGAYLAVNFFFGIYFFIKKREDIKLMLLSAGYLALNFSAILFSRSRSAMGALAVGIIIFMFYVFFIKKVRKADWYLTLLFLIFAVPIIFFKTGIAKIDDLLSLGTAPKTQAPVSAPAAPLSPEITESFDIRKIVWKGAWDLGLRYPLTGSGVETFAYSYYLERPVSHNMTTEWDFIYNKAHNEYLNYLATTGFTGLITYLIFIVAFIAYLIKLLRDSENHDPLFIMALFAAWSTILVTNFFGFSTTTTNLFIFLIPAVVIASVDKSPSVKQRSEGSPSPYFKGFAIFALSSGLVYILFSISSYIAADINYGQGIYYTKPSVSDQQKAAFYFQEAIKRRNEHVYDDKLSYSIAYLAGIAGYQKNQKVASQFISASEYYSIKSLKASPRNPLYWKTRAKNKYLYYTVNLDVNHLVEGVDALKTAVSLAPTDPKIRYSLAVFYSMLYNVEKDPAKKNNFMNMTIAEIDKSISLKKDFYDGYYMKGQFLKKTGNAAEAKAVFQYILSDVKSGDLPTLQEMDGL